MDIISVTIEGNPEDIEIARIGVGALVTAGDRVICEARYAKALKIAYAVYGPDRHGRPAATNSMIHEVLDQVDRVAGC